jgi:geranylgeranyl pyrophosphate synthase
MSDAACGIANDAGGRGVATAACATTDQAVRTSAAAGASTSAALAAAAVAPEGEALSQHVAACGAALELIHVASLIHDDVLDGATTRRGKPTLVASRGIAMALLAGDYLHAKAAELIVGVGRTEITSAFAGAGVRIVRGEFQDYLCRSTSGSAMSLPIYLDIIRDKTAALFVAACEIGGHLSNTPERERQALAQYGEDFGIAFQMIDDVLDFAPSAKDRFADVSAGVMSLPILLAMRRTNLVPADGRAFIDAVHETGALMDSGILAREHLERARRALSSVRSSEGVAALQGMVRELGSRLDTVEA